MELTINIEDKKLYDSLVQFLKTIGITIIGKQTPALTKTFSVQNKSSNSPVYGRLKGKIVTAPDFNEPLDDFKEYM